MREIPGASMQMVDWLLRLFDQTWHWGLGGILVSHAWRGGQPWMLIGFLTLTRCWDTERSASAESFLLIRRIVGGHACWWS
jgi:hypothetical protein